ncbi:hypothetical protein F4604DRAFT_1902569 [Suillus subluteus]|nr:hypothetical protein F4604DRAFT_1902569 [Suillus subluteus]
MKTPSSIAGSSSQSNLLLSQILVCTHHVGMIAEDDKAPGRRTSVIRLERVWGNHVPHFLKYIPRRVISPYPSGMCLALMPSMNTSRLARLHLLRPSQAARHLHRLLNDSSAILSQVIHASESSDVPNLEVQVSEWLHTKIDACQTAGTIESERTRLMGLCSVRARHFEPGCSSEIALMEMGTRGKFMEIWRMCVQDLRDFGSANVVESITRRSVDDPLDCMDNTWRTSA